MDREQKDLQKLFEAITKSGPKRMGWEDFSKVIDPLKISDAPPTTNPPEPPLAPPEDHEEDHDDVEFLQRVITKTQTIVQHYIPHFDILTASQRETILFLVFCVEVIDKIIFNIKRKHLKFKAASEQTIRDIREQTLTMDVPPEQRLHVLQKMEERIRIVIDYLNILKGLNSVNLWDIKTIRDGLSSKK